MDPSAELETCDDRIETGTKVPVLPGAGKRDLRRIVRLIVGITLVLLGILGLILPIMPGWVFLIPGLVILGDYFPPIQRLIVWAKARAAKAGFWNPDPS